MKIGYCAVTADILHSGHIKYLERCKEYCDYLIVGVMTDICVEKYKGTRPVMPIDERMLIIRSLKMVDKVIPQQTYEFPISKLIELYEVGIIFDSTDHHREGANYYLQYTPGISSSMIKERIKNS